MSKWEDNIEHNREMMVDSIMCRRDEPTSYRAPETDQKWRARNIISFHFRHFTYKAPPAYRDVLLCAIDHANPTTGRCDVGQRKIAVECNLSRQTVNEAIRWWEENTDFLQIENRRGKTNAYHIQGLTSKRIGTRFRTEFVWRQPGVTVTTKKGGVNINTDPTGGVSALTRH